MASWGGKGLSPIGEPRPSQYELEEPKGYLWNRILRVLVGGGRNLITGKEEFIDLGFPPLSLTLFYMYPTLDQLLTFF